MLENKPSIRHWAEDDRPREKMMSKGRAALSDAELIAILIGHGTRNLSAVDVGRLLLQASNNSLNELARMSVAEMCKVEGIGKAKAVAVSAALELGARKKAAPLREMPLKSSRDVYERMKVHLEDLRYEQFWMITLTQANRVIRIHLVGEGGLTGTVADPRRMLKLCLEDNAVAIILCHNHPSGNLKPSEPDIKLTRKMKHAAELLDIQLIDHLIVANTGYISLADEGLF
jgi:DNA repair protein RadC